MADRRLGETEVANLYLGSVRGRLWVQVDVPERVAVAVQNPELGPRFGEFVDTQALSTEGSFVRFDGEGRPPVTDGPFAETKDLIAGWMVIDVDSYERAVELAGELSAAPGAGGRPIHEWLELRPFLTSSHTIAD